MCVSVCVSVYVCVRVWSARTAQPVALRRNRPCMLALTSSVGVRQLIISSSHFSDLSFFIFLCEHASICDELTC